MREIKFIGELPSGYEYKFIRVDGEIRVIGISHDKSPIGFKLTNEKLVEMRLDSECATKEK